MTAEAQQQTLEPDAVGPGGTARRALLTPLQRAQHPAALDVWLAHCPSYHPAWAHYVCALCHLRPIPNDPTPVALHYPGAQYEIIVYASEPPPAPEDHMRWYEAVLNPVNLVYQFHGVTDEQARGVLARLVRAFCEGTCSADTDFRRLQESLLDKWISEARAAS